MTHLSIPFFSPSAVCVQVVPDGMVVKRITGKFQSLWANLNPKSQVTIKILNITVLYHQMKHEKMLTKFSKNAIRFPTNFGAG